MKIEKNRYQIIDLNKYIKYKNYNFDKLKIAYGNKLCINIRLVGDKAVLRSIFLPNCPIEEAIIFEAKNPDGESSSDILITKII